MESGTFGRRRCTATIKTSAIIRERFLALRDGDRFWYQSALASRDLSLVQNVRLADVIRRNTDIRSEIADDVFRAPGS